MSAKLLYASPLWLIANGIRYSHATWDKSDSFNINKELSKCTCPNCGKDVQKYSEYDDYIHCNYTTIESNHIGSKDFDLIKRVGFKLKHESVLEHSMIVYHIECSRAVLQELARHRHISLTVKSTRYTIKKLLREKFEVNWDKREYSSSFEKYLVLTGDWDVDRYNISMLLALIKNLKENKSNDIVKYMLPEAFKTELQLSLNLRELIHILELRTSKDALWEFRQVAFEMINVLPLEYKELIMENKIIKDNYERANNTTKNN